MWGIGKGRGIRGREEGGEVYNGLYGIAMKIDGIRYSGFRLNHNLCHGLEFKDWTLVSFRITGLEASNRRMGFKWCMIHMQTYLDMLVLLLDLSIC
jgi:hypothetical protein